MLIVQVAPAVLAVPVVLVVLVALVALVLPVATSRYSYEYY